MTKDNLLALSNIAMIATAMMIGFFFGWLGLAIYIAGVLISAIHCTIYDTYEQESKELHQSGETV